MSFEKLLADLEQASSEQETLSKALPTDDGTDDEKIQAAAVEGASGSVDGGITEGEGGAEGAAKKEPLTKSLQVTLPSGEVVEAEDGTELVKSLTARLGTAEEILTKSVTGLVGMLKQQGDMIKSLGDQVTKLRGEGRGRKAVLTVTEKAAVSPLAKATPQGVTGQEFMAKAMSAQRDGRITGLEISIAEGYLNKNQPVPENIVSRVLAE